LIQRSKALQSFCKSIPMLFKSSDIIIVQAQFFGLL